MAPYLLRVQARVGTALGRRRVPPTLRGQHLVRYLASNLARLHVAADELMHVASTC